MTRSAALLYTDFDPLFAKGAPHSRRSFHPLCRGTTPCSGERTGREQTSQALLFHPVLTASPCSSQRSARASFKGGPIHWPKQSSTVLPDPSAFRALKHLTDRERVPLGKDPFAKAQPSEKRAAFHSISSWASWPYSPCLSSDSSSCSAGKSRRKARPQDREKASQSMRRIRHEQPRCGSTCIFGDESQQERGSLESLFEKKKAGTNGKTHELCNIAQTQPLHDVRTMGLHRFDADSQSIGDTLIGILLRPAR